MSSLRYILKVLIDSFLNVYCSSTYSYSYHASPQSYLQTIALWLRRWCCISLSTFLLPYHSHLPSTYVSLLFEPLSSLWTRIIPPDLHSLTSCHKITDLIWDNSAVLAPWCSNDSGWEVFSEGIDYCEWLQSLEEQCNNLVSCLARHMHHKNSRTTDVGWLKWHV